MRVLLVEDQESLAEAIATHLRLKGFAVDGVSTVAATRLALQVGDIDIALFDLALPDGDGLSLLKALRADGYCLPIIIMTAKDQISDRVKGLEAGADDYLVKPFDLHELVARIHAVARRIGGNPNPVITIGQFALDRNGHRLLLDGHDVLLTAKEWALVEKLTAKPDAIVGKKQLEEALYSFDDDISSNTLEVYISRVRKKLGKESVQTVRGLGYRFTGRSH